MVLQTLVSLGPSHGYAIAARLEQVSGGALVLNMGTLYPALMRLEQRGLVRGRWGTTEKNRRARFYGITPGRAAARGRREARPGPDGLHHRRALSGAGGDGGRASLTRPRESLRRTGRECRRPPAGARPADEENHDGHASRVAASSVGGAPARPDGSRSGELGLERDDVAGFGADLHVDKTPYARRLVDDAGKHYFLSRPRRFGKSLLVDTLK